MAKENAQPGDDNSPITKPDETDTDPQIQPSQVTLPEDGSEPTVEEGEAAAEEEGKKPDPAAAAPDRRVPNRVPAKQRINQLVHRSRTAEGHAERLTAENQELKRKMAEGETRTQQVNAAAMDTHEHRWKAERDLATRELIDAKNAADPTKEAAAVGRLSRAESELGNIETWKANQPRKPAAQPEQRETPQGNGAAQPAQPIVIPPIMQDWVERNLWSVNDTRNPHFDAEMANYMAHQASIIEMRYHRTGKAAEIGNEQYFQEIDQAMRDEFPDRFEDGGEEGEPQPQRQAQPAARPANQRQAPTMQRNNGAAVAPAAQSAGQARPAGQAQQVNLTPEERQFAYNNAANGAYKYPIGHKLAGKNMNPADAEVHYARFKLRDMKENPGKR